MQSPDLDVLVNLRMIVGPQLARGEPAPRGNLLARVSLGAALSFVSGQPANDRWRYTADRDAQVLTDDDMQKIWQTPAYWNWLAAHD